MGLQALSRAFGEVGLHPVKRDGSAKPVLWRGSWVVGESTGISDMAGVCFRQKRAETFHSLESFVQPLRYPSGSSVKRLPPR